MNYSKNLLFLSFLMIFSCTDDMPEDRLIGRWSIENILFDLDNDGEFNDVEGANIGDCFPSTIFNFQPESILFLEWDLSVCPYPNYRSEAVLWTLSDDESFISINEPQSSNTETLPIHRLTSEELAIEFNTDSSDLGEIDILLELRKL